MDVLLNQLHQNVVAYVTAFKGINKDSSDAKTYGAIFNECIFTNSSDFVGKYAVARPWTAYSNVAVVNSTIGGNAATTESTTIATGLITDVNVSTLNIKFYGNKDGNDNAFTLTDDLTNVNTTLASDENYATYATAFSTSNGYAVSWDPEAQPIIEKDIIFNETGNYSTSSIVDLTEFTLAEEKNDTVGFRGKIKISVNANSIVEINGYSNSYTHFTVDGHNVYYNSSFYYATAGTLVIDTGSTTSYINSIKIYENITEETPVSLSGITLENTPAEGLAVGTDFDVSSINVKASYSNNTYEYVTDYTTDAATVINKNAAGTYTVTISYCGFEKTFDITYVSTVSDVFDEDFTITFGTNGNYSGLSKFNISDSTKVRNNGDNDTQFYSGNVLSFKVLPGAIIHINGNWSVGYTINGTTVKTTQAGGSDNAGLSYDYVCTGDTVEIESIHNNNYIISISISYLDQIDSDSTISFGSDGNYGSNSKVYVSNARSNGSNNSEVSNATVAFNVLAGATITISSYSGYTNYNITVDGVKSTTQTGTSYSVTAATDSAVIITTGSNNYFYWIKITFPNS